MKYGLPLILLLLVSMTYRGIGQEQIRGIVLDVETGEPIPGMTVWIPGSSKGTTTDKDGGFTLETEGMNDDRLMVQGIGYERLEISISDAEHSGDGILIRVRAKPIRLAETVVTAGRREQSLRTVPVSISTIGAEELAERIGTTFEESLRYVSGVNVMDDQINIRGSSGYSRGVGSRVLLLLDGVPLLTGDTGEIIWEMVPVDQIERVEVVKGAGSSLYGSGALGGVINVIPSRILEGTHAGVRISRGVYEQPPYDDWKWSERARNVSQGTILFSQGTDAWGTLFSVSRWMDESHRKNDVTHRYAIYNRSRFELTDIWSAHVTGHYVHRRGGNFFWWKSLRSPLEPPDDYAGRQVLSDRGFVALTLRGLHSERTVSFVRVQYYANAWSDKDVDVVTTESRSTRLFAEGQVTTEISQNHVLVGGGSMYIDRVRSNIFGTHPGVGGAVFLQDEYGVLPRIDLSVGVRLDWQRVSGLASGSQLDPRIGAAYRVSDDLSVRTSAGTGFRYPSIGELYTSIATGFGGVNVVPNTALTPERSVSYEAGLLFRFSRDGSLDMSVFQSDYEGLIEAAVDAQQLVIRFENVERARVRGVEISGEQMFMKKTLSLQAGYTYVDPINLRTGRVLRFRPRHIAMIGLRGSVGSVTATCEYRYGSRIEEIDENLVTVAEILDGTERSSIHTVNMRMFWSVSGLPFPVRTGLEVRNLTNHQYVELLANLAPPRTYVVSIEASL